MRPAGWKVFGHAMFELWQHNVTEVVAFVQRNFQKAALYRRTDPVNKFLNGNLEERWLTPRLIKKGLDEKGMGWHSFKRFRKTWLRGQRCLEDINNFWMAHRPQTMSELYSHLHEELQLRLAEAERVGYGFNLPKEGRGTQLSRMSRKLHQNSAVEKAA